MKNMKRLFALAVVLVLCLTCLLVPASAADDSAMLNEVKKSVVQIYGCTYSDYGYPLGNPWVGSGFAVGELGTDATYFVTNRHVVTNDVNYGAASKVRVWILLDNCTVDSQTKIPQRERSIECEIVYTTEEYPDIALLMAMEPISGFKPLPMLKSSELITDGSPVYALGFPGIIDGVSETSSGINDVTITSGIVSKHLTSPQVGNTRLILHDATINGGSSGGPLVNTKGQVVGLNTYTVGDDNSYSAAVDIDYVVNVLDRYNIKVTVVDGTEPVVEPTIETEKGGLSTGLIIGIAAAVVAVIAVIAVIAMNSKKKKAPVAGGVPVAPINNLATTPVAPAPAPAAGPSFKVRTPEGRVVTVTGSATIGRAHESTIRVPEDANGVSRNHCRLDVKGSTLVLTDTNSSCGTLIHGSKIPANTPVALKSGSSFALGSDKYTYTVL